MPADEALRARVCQPLRFTSTALIAAGAATTKVVSSERVIELNAVVGCCPVHLQSLVKLTIDHL